MANNLGMNNPLRYRGYVYDRETGLYYLQSRYYNPTIGRFINADSQLATGDFTGLNLFSYCQNNPVVLKDPNGKLGIIAIAGIVVSGIIGGAVAAISAASSGKDGWEVAANFAIGAAVGAGTAAVAVAASAAMIAGTITTAAGTGVVAGSSAVIGALGDGLSQLTEYAFHKDEADYTYDPIASTVSIVHSAFTNTISGVMSLGINTTFASSTDELAGLFVSGEASTALGGIDFAIRQLISAVIEFF